MTDEEADKTLVVPMMPQAFDACSQNGDFIDVLLIQTVNSHVLNLVPQNERGKYASAAAAALVGIQPKGELEGMLAAQLIACHNAAMECYRRAMNSQLPARDYHLNQANKLSRTYSTLLETLNRHRGKDQQKVTVEHVHVHAGGQAVVGMVETPGGGDRAKSKDQPHAKQVADASQPPMRSADEEWREMSVAGDAERALSHARRKVSRRT